MLMSSFYSVAFNFFGPCLWVNPPHPKPRGFSLNLNPPPLDIWTYVGRWTLRTVHIVYSLKIWDTASQKLF